MNFAQAMKALGEGKKVTRRSLAGDPPIYLYWNKATDTIMRDYGARTDAAWKTSLDSMMAEDWEEYVEPPKSPVHISELPFIITEQDFQGGKPVKEPDLDAETNKAIALVARNIAENLVELLRNPSVQRLLYKADVPLSKEDTNHV